MALRSIFGPPGLGVSGRRARFVHLASTAAKAIDPPDVDGCHHPSNVDDYA
jgi:hypothetical protein